MSLWQNSHRGCIDYNDYSHMSFRNLTYVCLISVDAKINTLVSEGKCSPSHGKSTKRASQFDLKLTRKKTKSNSRAYRLGFQMSLRWAYRQALPILWTTKRYCKRVINE